MAKEKVPRTELMWMTIVSILIPAILLVGSLIYVAFYANGYTLFQKVVVVVIALVISWVAESSLWIIWTGRKIVRWLQPK